MNSGGVVCDRPTSQFMNILDVLQAQRVAQVSFTLCLAILIHIFNPSGAAQCLSTACCLRCGTFHVSCCRWPKKTGTQSGKLLTGLDKKDKNRIQREVIMQDWRTSHTLIAEQKSSTVGNSEVAFHIQGYF